MRKIILTIFLSILYLMLSINLMATTLLDVRSNVRVMINQTSSDLTSFSDVFINNSINMAEEFVFNSLPVSINYNLIKSAEISVTIGNYIYSLPSDFRNILSVSINDKQAIQVNPPEFFALIDKAEITSDPMFFLMDNHIYIYSTPTTTTQTINLIYQVALTKLVNDTDTIELNPLLDNLLSVCASWMCLLQDGQDVRASSFEKLYSSVSMSILRRLTNTNVIEPIPNEDDMK